ncbi:MAG: hypothetical protein F6J97_15130 [Leptolyngbya sp. SIO4C1]|nr:hypothetical protein [Leptolyngbya sp. SIO4C1]
MNVRQESTLQLSDRVDTLYQMLEQINDKMSTLLAKQSSADRESGAGLATGSSRIHRNLVAIEQEAIDHKDILNDEPQLGDAQANHSQLLSPEIQIQRLTAQLTAAYNRIAALEEQVLTYRAHSNRAHSMG